MHTGKKTEWKFTTINLNDFPQLQQALKASQSRNFQTRNIIPLIHKIKRDKNLHEAMTVSGISLQGVTIHKGDYYYYYDEALNPNKSIKTTSHALILFSEKKITSDKGELDKYFDAWETFKGDKSHVLDDEVSQFYEEQGLELITRGGLRTRVEKYYSRTLSHDDSANKMSVPEPFQGRAEKKDFEGAKELKKIKQELIGEIMDQSEAWQEEASDLRTLLEEEKEKQDLLKTAFRGFLPSNKMISYAEAEEMSKEQGINLRNVILRGFFLLHNEQIEQLVKEQNKEPQKGEVERYKEYKEICKGYGLFENGEDRPSSKADSENQYKSGISTKK